jgi:hypothetical protein
VPFIPYGRLFESLMALNCNLIQDHLQHRFHQAPLLSQILSTPQPARANAIATGFFDLPRQASSSYSTTCPSTLQSPSLYQDSSIVRRCGPGPWCGRFMVMPLSSDVPSLFRRLNLLACVSWGGCYESFPGLLRFRPSIPSQTYCIYELFSCLFPFYVSCWWLASQSSNSALPCFILTAIKISSLVGESIRFWNSLSRA